MQYITLTDYYSKVFNITLHTNVLNTYKCTVIEFPYIILTKTKVSYKRVTNIHTDVSENTFIKNINLINPGS